MTKSDKESRKVPMVLDADREEALEFAERCLQGAHRAICFSKDEAFPDYGQRETLLNVISATRKALRLARD